MSYPGRLVETMDEHRALVDSIAARDVERAQNAARVHIENAEHTLMKSLTMAK
jgi:DNA-binding FadR family transcriptional regulator